MAIELHPELTLIEAGNIAAEHDCYIVYHGDGRYVITPRVGRSAPAVFTPVKRSSGHKIIRRQAE